MPTTANTIQKGVDATHISDSSIADTGTVVNIGNPIASTGTGVVTLILKQFPAQTSDFLQCKDSSNTGIFTNITADGTLTSMKLVSQGVFTCDNGSINSDGEGDLTTLGLAVSGGGLFNPVFQVVSGTSSLDNNQITTDGGGTLSCLALSVSGTTHLDNNAITTDGGGTLSCLALNVNSQPFLPPDSSTIINSGGFLAVAVPAIPPDGTTIINGGTLEVNSDLDINSITLQSGDEAVISLPNVVSAAASGVGTLTNAPVSGNPAFWLTINLAGTPYACPFWALS